MGGMKAANTGWAVPARPEPADTGPLEMDKARCCARDGGGLGRPEIPDRSGTDQ
jgi:hypothetical protein